MEPLRGSYGMLWPIIPGYAVLRLRPGVINMQPLRGYDTIEGVNVPTAPGLGNINIDFKITRI